MIEPSPLQPGDPARAGRYRLLGRLGVGGQGTVYLGEGPSGRRVAVKLLHAQLSRDERARERFLSEVTAIQQVRRFCTARVLDVNTDGSRPYIISEYVDGPSLAGLVQDEGPRDPDALDRLAVATITALAAIHKAGIVHRDFKPSNVICGPDGPRVIDFGIARALDITTTTGSPLGSPAFMSPEQVSAQRVGAASDVFSWASTMVYAASGRPPFNGDGIPATFYRILNAEPDLTVLSEPLTSTVEACLAKAPGDRPSALDVLLTLLGHAGPAAELGAAGDSPVNGPREGRANVGASLPAHAVETVADPISRPAAVHRAEPSRPQRSRRSLRPPRLTMIAVVAALGAVFTAVPLWRSTTQGTTADMTEEQPVPSVVGNDSATACRQIRDAGFICAEHDELASRYRVVTRQDEATVLSPGSVINIWSRTSECGRAPCSPLSAD